MRDLRFALRWQSIGLMLVGMTLIALLTPSSGGATVLRNLDKVAHVVGFLGLTLWFTGIYERRFYVWIAVAMLAFGALTELLQELLTRSRSGDLLDLIADAVGIGLALVIALAGGERWCEIVERRIP